MKWAEELFYSKTKSYRPRKKNTEVKKHFKNLLRNPPEVTEEPIKKIIYNQLDIKLA